MSQSVTETKQKTETFLKTDLNLSVVSSFLSMHNLCKSVCAGKTVRCYKGSRDGPFDHGGCGDVRGFVKWKLKQGMGG